MEPRRILLFIVIGLLAVYAWYRFDQRDGRRVPEKFTPAEAPKLNLEDVKVLAAIDHEYTKLINEVVPSVVSITSSRTFVQRAPLTIEDLIRGRQRAQLAKSTSLGSGVIVSKEGHILTNHHVIADMTEVRVQLTDGRNAAARLIGSDPSTDIAVLKVDENNLTPLPLGNSDDILVGQQVFAVGNPYGLEESVSRGIVSAKGRRTGGDSEVEFIQHDAAVNQGNSGGPLLNIRGEILGINSQIYSTSKAGAWQGISFAIPSNTARRVMESIIKRGRSSRAYLGIYRWQNLNPVLARNFGVPDTSGALIADILSGSPAAQAGLRPGDVVRTFGGRRIENAQALKAAFAATEVGREVEIIVIREGQELRFKATPTEVPPELLNVLQP
jgi:S1-C subfamily serine protease